MLAEARPDFFALNHYSSRLYTDAEGTFRPSCHWGDRH